MRKGLTMDVMLRRALRGFLGLLKQLYVNLLGDEGEVWGNELKKFLRKEPCWVGALTNLSGLFKDCKGLRVFDTFRERILAPALEMEETAPASVGEGYDPSTSMTDAQILEKIGNKIFENPRAFLNTLTRLIDEQWGGEEGILLNNGYNNLFYVRGVNEKGESEVFVVCISWYTINGDWGVSARLLEEDTWGAGRRAFPSKAEASLQVRHIDAHHPSRG